MVTSERQYKDLTVIREHVIRVGADGSDEVDTVMVERRLPDHVEIIMPSEPLFAEAVGATAIAEHLATIGAKGGTAKTPAKAKSSAANGAKGGRPRGWAPVGGYLGYRDAVNEANISSRKANPCVRYSDERGFFVASNLIQRGENEIQIGLAVRDANTNHDNLDAGKPRYGRVVGYLREKLGR